ncbi:MAG: flagellar biosynthesis anti-sigma factor FlgM [Terriglobales bacterium]
MKILDPNLDPSWAAQQRSQGSSPVASTRTSVPPSGSGNTVSSSDATRLGSSVVGLTAQALAQPETRSEMVSQLRAQIAGGNYVVQATAVADAMLADPQTGLGTLGHG